MAQRRLTDSELANKVRAGNVRRAERRRERLATAGYVQTVVWLSQVTRSALDTTAAERNATISETAERLLSAGLTATTAPVSPAPSPSPPPVETMLERFGEPAPPATLTVDATPAPKPTAGDLTLELFERPEPATRKYETVPEKHHSSGPPPSGTYSPPLPYRGNSTPTGKDALMREIGAMLDKGLLGADIARSLNASGRRTASGKEFQGANVLRDYRAWAKKSGAVDATTRETT